MPRAHLASLSFQDDSSGGTAARTPIRLQSLRGQVEALVRKQRARGRARATMSGLMRAQAHLHNNDTGSCSPSNSATTMTHRSAVMSLRVTSRPSCHRRDLEGELLRRLPYDTLTRMTRGRQTHLRQACLCRGRRVSRNSVTYNVTRHDIRCDTSEAVDARVTLCYMRFLRRNFSRHDSATSQTYWKSMQIRINHLSVLFPFFFSPSASPVLAEKCQI